MTTTKLLMGPTTEVRISSRVGFRKFLGFTGVGFAHPSTGKCDTSAISGKNYRAKQVNMLDRVQGNPAQHAGSRVTATVRHPGVRRLVNADREQENDQLEQNVYMLKGHCEVEFESNTRFMRDFGVRKLLL